MYYIIANIHAGSGNGKIALEQVTQYLEKENKPYKVAITEYEGHASELTIMALAEKCHHIIVVGGDGSFMEVATAVGEREDVAIGFIPAGNGNDFAYSVGIENDTIKCMEGILKNEATEIDYISVNGVKSLNVCGCGLDTEVLVDYNKRAKKTKFSYVKSLIKVLMNFKFYRLKINIDNLKTFEDEYMLACCCNGRRFGAKIMICPPASCEDSLMDLVLIKKVAKWKIPFLLLGFIKGKHIGKSYCLHTKCSYVKIERADNKEMLINCDGQLYSNKELEAKIVPCKLLCLNQLVRDKKSI